MHDLQPRGPRRRGRPEGTRADLPEGGLGRAQSDRDLGEHPRGDGRRAGQGRPQGGRHRRRRHHQPTRDGDGLGQEHRRTGLQRHRLAGHPHRRHLPAARRTRRRRRALQGQGGPAPGHLLLRTQGPVDPRQRRGCPGEGRGRRPGVRQHGHLDHLEHDRRHRRWPAHHRADQRLPDPADGSGHADLGCLDRGGHGHPDVDAPGDQVVLPGVRRGTPPWCPGRSAHLGHPR